MKVRNKNQRKAVPSPAPVLVSSPLLYTADSGEIRRRAFRQRKYNLLSAKVQGNALAFGEMGQMAYCFHFREVSRAIPLVVEIHAKPVTFQAEIIGT